MAIPAEAKALVLWKDEPKASLRELALDPAELDAGVGAAWLRADVEDDGDVFRCPAPPEKKGASATLDIRALPAPPLKLGSAQPIRGGIVLAMRFERELLDGERVLLMRVLSLCEASYGAFGEGSYTLEGRELVWTLKTMSSVDDQDVRGQCYWLVEQLDRFLPLASADVLGPRRRRSRLPPWLGPAAIMLAALLCARVLEGAAALRTVGLIWAFAPLVLTFLYRRRLHGRGAALAWTTAAIHGALQLGATWLMSSPASLWPPPEDLNALVEYHRSLNEGLARLVDGTRILALVWALVHIGSVRYSDRQRGA